MTFNFLQKCMTENENFVQQTIEAAEALYRKDFEAEVAAFAAKNSGSLLGDLASMVSFNTWGKLSKYN